MELLLDSGANVHERGGSDGETALLVAVRKGDRATVKFLLARGADVEARDLGTIQIHFERPCRSRRELPQLNKLYEWLVL